MKSYCGTCIKEVFWYHSIFCGEIVENVIYYNLNNCKRKINQRIEKILQFLYTVIRTANILIYIVPEQSAMTFLFQGANSARAVSVILVLGRRSSR